MSLRGKRDDQRFSLCASFVVWSDKMLANIDTGTAANPPLWSHQQFHNLSTSTTCILQTNQFDIMQNGGEQLIPASWNRHRCVSSLLISQQHTSSFWFGFWWMRMIILHLLGWRAERGCFSLRQQRAHIANLSKRKHLVCPSSVDRRGNKMGDSNISK